MDGGIKSLKYRSKGETEVRREMRTSKWHQEHENHEKQDLASERAGSHSFHLILKRIQKKAIRN